MDDDMKLNNFTFWLSLVASVDQSGRARSVINILISRSCAVGSCFHHEQGFASTSVSLANRECGK